MTDLGDQICHGTDLGANLRYVPRKLGNLTKAKNLGSFILRLLRMPTQDNSFEVFKIEVILHSSEPENLWTKYFSLKVLSSVTKHLSRQRPL